LFLSDVLADNARMYKKKAGNDKLVGAVLEKMLPHVVLSKVLERISRDDRFPRFQRALSGLMGAFKLQLGALQAAKRVAEADLFVLGERRRLAEGRGMRMSDGNGEDAVAPKKLSAKSIFVGDGISQVRWDALNSGGQVDLFSVMLLGTSYALNCKVVYDEDEML